MMAFDEPTLPALLRKAEFYRCNVRRSPEGYVNIFCPPGYGLRFNTKPTAIHAVYEVQASHVTPYRLNPRVRDPPAAQDFLEKYPQCRYSSMGSVMGSRTTILEFDCGDMPVYELGEMMEWLINTSQYAMKVAYSGPDPGYYRGPGRGR